ncbi:MAG: hypothetical protein ACRD7E_22345 [Bryobacteraceae bacterium]
MRSLPYTTLLGGMMALTSFASQHADEIYRTGQETLIGESAAIVAGPVSNYSKDVVSQSQPGPDGVPLKWVVSGRVENPQLLKGQGRPGPVDFSRPEQSMLVPKDPSKPHWEDVYGELGSGDRVVLFLGPEPASNVLAVVPSGTGERDFIGLVKDIVALQSIPDQGARVKRWIAYMDGASADEGRKAALRSLVAVPVAWEQMRPALENMLGAPQISPGFRAFVFGIVAFAVMEEKWGAEQQNAAGFLCRLFLAERDARLALQYILHLKLILRYGDSEKHRKAREPVLHQVVDCLRRRETMGGLDPQMQEQYRQIRATHPGQL